MDKEQLGSLVDKLCRLDIEPDDREVDADDVKRKFEDDDRAKRCKQKDGYPDFTPVGETYPACRS